MRIIWIEDEPWDVNTERGVLEDMGHEVTMYHWPDDGPLPKLSAFDLILLDIIMPSGEFTDHETHEGFLTGVILHRKMIAPKYPNARVVMISSLPPGTRNYKMATTYAQKNGIVYVEKSLVSTSIERVLE